MILHHLAAEIDFNLDKNFSFAPSHDSKSVFCSDGKYRFIDRGFTTYTATGTYTDTLDKVNALADFIDSRRGSNMGLTLFPGEEFFGPHFEISVSGSVFTVVSSSMSEVRRNNLVQASVELSFELYVADKSTYNYRSDITPGIDGLKYPYNYQARNKKVATHLTTIGRSIVPHTHEYSDLEFSGSFTLIEDELVAFLLFWEQNGHIAFAMPALLAPLFIPYDVPDGLRIASVSNVSRLNRFQWSIAITFVPSDYVPPFVLSRVDYKNVKMIADNDNVSTFQLTAYDTDDNDVTADVTWVSGISSIQVVDGLMTCIGDTNGIFNVSALSGGVTKWCSVEGFATIPSLANRRLMAGGNGGDTAIDPYTTLAFAQVTTPLQAAQISHRQAFSEWVITGTQNFFTVQSDLLNFTQFAHRNTGIIAYNGTSGGPGGTTDSFGPSRVTGTKVNTDFSKSSDGYTYDGVVYAPSSISGAFEANDNILMRFRNSLGKLVHASSSSQDITDTELLDYSKCDLYYSPQIFAQPEDALEETTVFNLGLEGDTFDLNAVFADEWFDI